jgi:hypothetical protein
MLGILSNLLPSDLSRASWHTPATLAALILLAAGMLAAPVNAPVFDRQSSTRRETPASTPPLPGERFEIRSMTTARYEASVWCSAGIAGADSVPATPCRLPGAKQDPQFSGVGRIGPQFAWAHPSLPIHVADDEI